MTHSRFDLREEPFEVDSTVCPPFASLDHQEVFNGFFLALLARKRVLVLCGETGVGKTSLVRALLGHAEADGGLTLAVTASPGMSVEDLVVAAGPKLGPPSQPGAAGGRDVERVVGELEERLEEAGSGVLVVDEAHSLDASIVRDLIELAHSDTETGRYMQVLLSGEPELEQILAEPGLAEAIRRSGLVSHLRPLDREQVEQFVRSRLRMAGGRRDDLFDARALDLVTLLSSGLPAVINPLCAQALRLAEGAGQERVTRDHILEAAEQLGIEAQSVKEPSPRRSAEPTPILPLSAPARPAPRRPDTAPPRPSLRAETPLGRPKTKLRSSGRLRWAAMGTAAILLGAGTGLALSESRPLDHLYQRVTGTPAPWSDWIQDADTVVIPPEPGSTGSPDAAVTVRPVPAVNPPPADPAPVREAMESPILPQRSEPEPQLASPAPEPLDTEPASSVPDDTQLAALPPADASPPPPPPQEADRPDPNAERIAQLVQKAERYLEARYLTTPAGTNAFDVYNQIVALDPDNPDAARILNRIKDNYLDWGATAEATGNIENARLYYERGLTVDPDDPALRVRLEALDRKMEASAPPAAPDDEDTAQAYPELEPDQVLRLPPDYEAPPKPPAAFSAPPRTAQPNTFDTQDAVLAALARPEVLDAVIRAGRDINRELPSGKTPLILAAERGHTAAAYRLLRAGAAPNARSQTGATALMAAAANGDEATVRALLQHGGAVNAMDVQGRTPLMAAAERGHLDTVRLLLDHGADINATTSMGENAYDLAVGTGHAHVATLLRLRGAQASGSGSATPIDLRTFRIN